jgi:hypothetical protein
MTTKENLTQTTTTREDVTMQSLDTTEIVANVMQLATNAEESGLIWYMHRCWATCTTQEECDWMLDRLGKKILATWIAGTVETIDWRNVPLIQQRPEPLDPLRKPDGKDSNGTDAVGEAQGMETEDNVEEETVTEEQTPIIPPTPPTMKAEPKETNGMKQKKKKTNRKRQGGRVRVQIDPAQRNMTEIKTPTETQVRKQNPPPVAVPTQRRERTKTTRATQVRRDPLHRQKQKKRTTRMKQARRSQCRRLRWVAIVKKQTSELPPFCCPWKMKKMMMTAHSLNRGLRLPKTEMATKWMGPWRLKQLTTRIEVFSPRLWKTKKMMMTAHPTALPPHCRSWRMKKMMMTAHSTQLPPHCRPWRMKKMMMTAHCSQ